MMNGIMRKSIGIILTFFILISLLSCRNELIPLNENLLDKANDFTPPEVIIESPTVDSVFGQAVTISGTVSDDGSILPILNYQVVNDLGEIKSEGIVDVVAIEAESGVAGSFEFRFPTEYMSSDILISLTATDWNGNIKSPSPLRLKYPGNAIPSLSVVSGNNSITLSWDALSDATEYRVYFTKNKEIFTEGSASMVIITPEEGMKHITYVLNSTEHGIRNNRLSQIMVRAITPESTLDSSLLNLVPLSSESLSPRLTVGTDGVYINWNPIQCTEGVQVEYSLWRSESDREGSYSRITPAGWHFSHFTDESISEGRTYCYRVSSDSVSNVMSSPAVCKSLNSIPGSYKVESRELLPDNIKTLSYYTFTPDGSRLFVFEKQFSNNTIMELNIHSGGIVGTPYTVDEGILGITADNDTLFILKKGSTAVEKHIVSLDISTTGTITELDSIKIDYAKGLCLKDQTLYLSKSNSENHFTVDAGTPSDLKTEQLLDYAGAISVTSGSIYDICISGDNLYSRCKDDTGESQVAIYNIGSGIWSAKNLIDDAPGITQSDLYYSYLSVNEHSGKLTIINDSSYISSSDVMLWVYDIETDGSLTLMEFKILEDRNTNYQSKPIIIGNTLFVSRANDTVQAISIAGRIYEKKNHSIPHYPKLLNPDGNKLFVSTYDDGAVLLTLSEGYPLSLRKTWSPALPACGPIAFDGGRLFTYGNYRTISQFECNFDDSLSLLNSDNADGTGIAVYGNTLFLRTGARRVDMYEINSTGVLGGKIGEIDTAREVFSISFAGDYLIAGEKFKVEVFDISDLANVYSLCEFDSNYNVTGSIVYEETLLILDGNYGLCCYDFSDPKNPLLQGVFYDQSSSSRTVHSVDVQEGVVYLGSDTGLFVLNLDDASNWRSAETNVDNRGSAICWIEGDVKAVKAAGKYLFFSNSGYLGAFSLANPKKPELYYEDPECRDINSIALWGNSLYGQTTGAFYSYSLDD